VDEVKVTYTVWPIVLGSDTVALCAELALPE
jgi:hypothetical protein